VHEALLFSATLRLPEGVGPAQVRAFVAEIERVVEVEDIVHALVGMPGTTSTTPRSSSASAWGICPDAVQASFNTCAKVERMFWLPVLHRAGCDISSGCMFTGQNGLSVQQRKRLTIAVELAANPSIVFMDEPTTGR
jgi:ABC-type glutathione transport system ATPase component